MKHRSSKLARLALSAVLLAASAVEPAIACTRTLFVGDENTVITGRNMDWKEDMASNLWIFPAGMKRDGAGGPASIQWISKFGSVIVSGYEAGTTDGLNEKGLVANLLYLAESQYPKAVEGRPFLSIAAWAPFGRSITAGWMLDLWVGSILATLVSAWLYKEN